MLPSRTGILTEEIRVRALLNNGTDERKKDYLQKILTKLSTDCIFIVFLCERTFGGQ